MTFGLGMTVTNIKLKTMKPSVLSAATMMFILSMTINLSAQPGHARNGKAKHYPSHKAAGLHDNRNKKSHYVYNGHEVFIKYHGHDYKYSQGRFYQRHNYGFRMVPPPYGIRVGFIPDGYMMINVGGVSYFYFEGVFYRHNRAGRYYEVTAPPQGAVVPRLPGKGVRKMVYKGGNVLEYGNVLYRPVNTEMGVQFRVAGFIGSIFVAI